MLTGAVGNDDGASCQLVVALPCHCGVSTGATALSGFEVTRWAAAPCGTRRTIQLGQPQHNSLRELTGATATPGGSGATTFAMSSHMAPAVDATLRQSDI